MGEGLITNRGARFLRGFNLLPTFELGPMAGISAEYKRSSLSLRYELSDITSLEKGAFYTKMGFYLLAAYRIN